MSKNKTTDHFLHDPISEMIEFRIRFSLLEAEYYKTCDKLRYAESLINARRSVSDQLDATKKEAKFWADKYLNTEEGKKEIFGK